MKSLEAFEFTGRGGKGSYDWSKILDGGIYKLDKGSDFECEVGTFALMARTNAARKNKNIRISQDEKAGTVVLQAYAMTDEEKQENQAKLAAQKEKAAAKRAEKRGNGANQTTANGIHPAVTAADAPASAPKPVAAPKPAAAKPATAGKGK